MMSYGNRVNPHGRVCAGFFLFVLVTAAWVSSVSAQTSVRLSGTIRNRETREPVPGASIALLGTTRGAVANAEGRYSILLGAHVQHRLRVTAIGYRPDTLLLSLDSDTKRDVLLASTPITNALITVTPENTRAEAERIVREAIRAKEPWQRDLKTYRFQVYARLNLQTIDDADSTILSVLESEANGYWSKEKGYSEEITARRQTANLPAAVNRISLFKVVDFYDDRLELGEYSLPGPLAKDALSHYDFDLQGLGEIAGEQAYTISIEPKNTLIPGFVGKLWISQVDYSLLYLSVGLSDAVKLGPIRDAHIEETFSLVENKYWLPNQLTFRVSAKLQLPFIPVFHLEHVSVMQNYLANREIPDSLFSHQLHRVDPGADSTDSLAWNAVRTVPLTTSEELAYRHIDSVAKLPVEEKQFSPFDALLSSVFNPDLYQYNRVEASRFEIQNGFEQLGSWPLGLDARAAYGTGDARFKYDVDLSQALLWNTRSAVEASFSSGGTFRARSAERIEPVLTADVRVSDDRVRIGESRSLFYNTLTSLLFKEDYPDYFRGRDVELGLLYTISERASIGLRFKSEVESSMDTVGARFSVFGRSRQFRVNPAVDAGRLSAFTLVADLDRQSTKYTVYSRLDAEVASKSLGSDFVFSSISEHVALLVSLGGLGQCMIQLHGGYFLSGEGGVQHNFIFETPQDFADHARAFLTMRSREFVGQQILQFYFEQNFYDLPTRLFGLHILDPLQLQWFGIFNAGKSWDPGAYSTGAMADSSVVNPQSVQGQPYLEAGFGIGNIFNLFRFDAGWRLTHRRTDVSNISIRGTLGFTF